MDNNFQVHAKLLARAATGPRSGDNQNKSRAEQGRAEQVSRGIPRCSKAIQNLVKPAIMYVFSGGKALTRCGCTYALGTPLKVALNLYISSDANRKLNRILHSPFSTLNVLSSPVEQQIIG